MTENVKIVVKYSNIAGFDKRNFCKKIESSSDGLWVRRIERGEKR